MKLLYQHKDLFPNCGKAVLLILLAGSNCTRSPANTKTKSYTSGIILFTSVQGHFITICCSIRCPCVVDTPAAATTILPDKLVDHTSTFCTWPDIWYIHICSHVAEISNGKHQKLTTYQCDCSKKLHKNFQCKRKCCMSFGQTKANTTRMSMVTTLCHKYQTHHLDHEWQWLATILTSSGDSGNKDV